MTYYCIKATTMPQVNYLRTQIARARRHTWADQQPHRTADKSALTTSLWERVTAYRFANFLDSESAALRELVELGLEAAERKPAPAKKPATARGSRTKPRG